MSKWSENYHLVKEIDAALDGIIEIDEQHEMSILLHRNVIAHCIAIHILLEKKLLTSAQPLLRLLFESLVKAHWFKLCATQQDIKGYIDGQEIYFRKEDGIIVKEKSSGKNKNKKKKSIQDLIDNVENRDSKLGRNLKQFYKKNSPIIHSFVHSGTYQLSSMQSGTGFQQIDNPEQYNWISKKSIALAISSVDEISNIMIDDHRVKQKITEIRYKLYQTIAPDEPAFKQDTGELTSL
tara:strand:+ start:4080 stop:4790 length:711 start_codon:yes stop_codon:yes gene_type:complete